jgi:hypothetical protein
VGALSVIFMTDSVTSGYASPLLIGDALPRFRYAADSLGEKLRKLRRTTRKLDNTEVIIILNQTCVDIA